MGAPQLYGTEMVQRCRTLLEKLEPHANEINQNESSPGSLSVTFLLTMAHPMIIQPYERFIKGAGSRFKLRTNEGELGKAFKRLVPSGSDGIAGTPLDGIWTWSFASFPAQASNYLPYKEGTMLLDLKLKESLDGDQARADARKRSPYTLLEILRHSMAHGNIIYLNSEGDVAHGTKVSKLLFANERPRTLGRPGIEAYDFLQISVTDFRKFLESWAEALKKLEKEVLG